MSWDGIDDELESVEADAGNKSPGWFYNAVRDWAFGRNDCSEAHFVFWRVCQKHADTGGKDQDIVLAAIEKLSELPSNWRVGKREFEEALVDEIGKRRKPKTHCSVCQNVGMVTALKNPEESRDYTLYSQSAFMAMWPQINPNVWRVPVVCTCDWGKAFRDSEVEIPYDMALTPVRDVDKNLPVAEDWKQPGLLPLPEDGEGFIGYVTRVGARL